MAASPLISIITPSFNSGEYIERAIQSVLSQDYDNWEHIIVDGGSIDGTLEVLKKYQHLELVSEPDKGIYDAMNKGIHMAKGEWLYFLGADDTLYSPNTFLEIVPYLNDASQVVYGNVLNVKNGKYFKGEFNDERIFNENICHQGIFFRKEVFKTTGLFDLKYHILSDWDHNMKWMLDKDIRKRYIDIPIARYAADGVSNTTNDSVFYRNRRLNFVKYASKSQMSYYIRSFSLLELKRSIVKLSPSLFIKALYCFVKQNFLMIFRDKATSSE